MQAEVIAIGDELTSGVRLDTNSQWLSQRLGENGINVRYHTTVGDDLEANVRVFREAIDRADVVLCTGGLGPTADDLTRQAIAEATGTELLLDEQMLAHIRALFARRKREMPPQNVVQAYFPAGSHPIPNPHGSAPGIDMQVPRAGRSPSRIFAVPGVPAEMREMWYATVEPALREFAGGTRRVIRHRRVKCFGVGESDLEQMLPDLIRRGRNPSVGITVSKATITLRVTAAAESDDLCLAAMEPTLNTIRECLGHLAFGEEDEELQHVVVRLLRQHDQSLSLVEWGTGGLVSHWLDEAGASPDHFRGAMVIHDEIVLKNLLELDENLLTRRDSNNGELVAAMAEAGRRRFGTDFSLAIGPFPRADSDTAEPGEFQYALATADGAQLKSSFFAGHPEILKPRGGKLALDLLRRSLMSLGR